MTIISCVAVSVALLLCSIIGVIGDQERFDEVLTAKKIGDGDDGTVLGSWKFRTTWVHGEKKWNAFNLFPKALGQVIEQFQVREMRLSFSKGRWQDQVWGYQTDPAAAGVEMFAHLSSQNASSIYGARDSWTRLLRSLSGMTCASLDTLSERSSALNPFSDLDADEGSEYHYGQLSSEASCTENLTPWLKLLPCRKHAGLGAAIVPTTVFGADFHSFSIHYKRLCYTNEGKRSISSTWNKCEQPASELTLILNVVRKHVNKADGILEALTNIKNVELSACPLATTSEIWLYNNDSASPCDESIKKFPLGTVSDKIIGSPLTDSKAGFVRATRVVTGTGNSHGGIEIYLVVSSVAPSEIKVSLTELLPAYLRLVPSSLKFVVNGQARDPRTLWHHDNPSSKLFLGVSTQGPPSIIGLNFIAHPGEKIHLSFDFKQAFLPLEAFPADPNRGMDIPATVIRFSWEDSCGSSKAVVYTDSAMIIMPLPDFSMPYNVITLSSTVMAFFISGLIANLVRKTSVEVEILDARGKKKEKFKKALKLILIASSLGLAWLFENDRDSFDQLLERFY